MSRSPEDDEASGGGTCIVTDTPTLTRPPTASPWAPGPRVRMGRRARRTEEAAVAANQNKAPRLLLLLLPLLAGGVRGYEAEVELQDLFSWRACPAFLTFTNAAYLAGSTVELPCHCKPQKVNSVVWFFRKHLDGAEETRALTDLHGNMIVDAQRVLRSGDLRSRFSIRLFSLLVFRAGPLDSGLYLCGSTRNDFFNAYDLDIQEAHALTLVPRFSPTPVPTHPPANGSAHQPANVSAHQPAHGSAHHGQYQVFTHFQRWSHCDRCGVEGEQVRVGLCYVHSHFLHVRYRRANQTAVSCGSGAVPRVFGLSRRSRTEAKMEVRPCHRTCPPQAPPPSNLDSLKAFLGFSTPSEQQGVTVYFLSHPARKVLTLGCPGSQPRLAVAWDRGPVPLYRSHQLWPNSSEAPRVYMDPGHHLVFTPAKTQDSGTYYCWLQGRRVAEVRLLVYGHFGRGEGVTSHPDFPWALRTVLVSYAAMTTVFILLLLARAGVQHRRRRFTFWK